MCSFPHALHLVAGSSKSSGPAFADRRVLSGFLGYRALSLLLK